MTRNRLGSPVGGLLAATTSGVKGEEEAVDEENGPFSVRPEWGPGGSEPLSASGEKLERADSLVLTAAALRTRRGESESAAATGMNCIAKRLSPLT